MAEEGACRPPKRTEHEKQYSPSEWSKRYGPNEVIEQHIRVITLQSNCNRVDIPSNLNISYRQITEKRNGQETKTNESLTYSEGTKLDIFGTDLEKNSPIFVFFSGGYWQLLCGELSSYPAGPLHMNNVVSIIVDYDRAPKVTMDEIVQQAVDAMKWIVNYAVENKSRSISICGHSAGAQLCAMILASKWFELLPTEHKNLFKGAFLMAGVFDLRPLLTTYVNEPLSMTLHDAEINSPILLCNKIVKNLLMRNSKTPIYIDLIVGENDSPAFKEQTKSFGEELSKHVNSKIDEVTITTTVIPDLDHFDLAENLRNISYEVVQRMVQVIGN